MDFFFFRTLCHVIELTTKFNFPPWTFVPCGLHTDNVSILGGCCTTTFLARGQSPWEGMVVSMLMSNWQILSMIKLVQSGGEKDSHHFPFLYGLFVHSSGGYL